MREKLIELLNDNFCEYCNVDIIAGNCKIRAITFDCDRFADFLVSNGVTIPVRCKDCNHHEDCIRRIQFWGRDSVLELNTTEYHPIDFCSYGERRTDD